MSKNKKYIRKAKKIYGRYLNKKEYCANCKDKGNNSICFKCDIDECHSCALEHIKNCYNCCNNSLREVINNIKTMAI